LRKFIIKNIVKLIMIEFEKNTESINTVYRIFYLIVFIFSVNIINIQIINHSKYYLMSEKNRVRNIPKIGPRGNIITFDGISVATNKPSYSIIYFPKENVSENRMLELSKKLASISLSDYKSINELIKKAQSTLKPVKLIDNISSKSAMFFYEIKNIFPEIEIVEENRRYYPYSSLLSHIIGYTGRMDEEDVKYYLKKGYSLDSYVGKTGVEKKYEEYLKGKDGGLFMEVDNRGRIIRLLGFEDWEKGSDVILTIDFKLQKAAEDALSKLPYKRGACVAVDSTNGKVLVYAVKPGYDLNYFSAYRDETSTSTKIDQFNIPIQGLYPPASTFKIITAISALESGRFDTSTKYYCPGYYDAGNRVFKCWEKKGHKWQDIISGLANSCDVFFYNVAYLIGPYEIESMAKKFRLDQKTFIDLPYEKAGKIYGPSSRINSRGYWFIGDTLNMAIGQGETLVTPMEMLMVVMALSNGGKFYKPYYVDRIISSDGKVIFQNVSQILGSITLKKETYDIIYQAMRAVVKEGTGKTCDINDVEVYGKTGTAQNPHGKDHAWFIAFAKKEGYNPIAISVLIEHGEHGSSAAAPVARDVIKEYFKSKDSISKLEVSE